MGKDVVLITNFWHFKCEKASSRYLSLANTLVKEGYKLEVITSNFYHRTKKIRNFSEDFLNSFDYKITLLHECSYKKNISFRRLYAHHFFSKQVLQYLKTRKKPDVVIVVIPTHEVAKKVVNFCNKNNIPVILDIQDLWPEAFQMAFDIPIISNLAFWPIKKEADFAYKNANYIIGVSNEYVNRALKSNPNQINKTTIYLGSDYMYARNAIKNIDVVKPKQEFWITYIGALGYSYNIKLVIDAIAKLKTRGISNIRFHIFGNGVLENEFKDYANRKGVETVFFGHTEYGKMMAWLSHTDIAVNPITGKSVASIINKVCDYATAGVPVINDQNCIEYRALIEEYKCGINCENGNIDEFSDAIFELYNNLELRKKMGGNALIMAQEKFNREKTYGGFIKAIESF